MEEIKISTGDRVTVLRKFASIANAVVSHHLDDKKFKGMISFAVEQKITNAATLGRIINADEARANEWLSGQNYPTAQEQATILSKTADDAEAEAKQLQSQSPKN